jgi:thiamine biosynthesis protein ThiI
LAHATSIVAAHYAEIALKGKNRPQFLRRLIANIKLALADEPVINIDHVESRLLVRLAAPERAEEVATKLQRVFGLEWLSPAVPLPRDEVGQDLEGLCRLAVTLAAQDVGNARHFKVEARRSDRTFPLESPEINRIVGAAIQAAINLPVQLKRPDFTLRLLVLKRMVLLFTRKIPGHGGLPAGSSGRVTVLMSGGIDSPVAAWSLMKRGCRPEFVHFYAGRTAVEADSAKIEKLVAILCNYSPTPLSLHLVPAYPYELRAIGQIDTHYDMIMFRRFMVKTAEQLALRSGSLALITGDSLGQVASQTLPNLAAISPDVSLPILRPLIGLNKHEITNLAVTIGTYDTSILPYRDCCSIRSPHPVLNARAEDLLQYSHAMDLDGAVADAIDATTRIRIG